MQPLYVAHKTYAKSLPGIRFYRTKNQKNRLDEAHNPMKSKGGYGKRVEL
jgi:hypothetical protein